MKFLNFGSVCLPILILFTNTFSWADPADQQSTDGWFCEQGEQNKEWICVQSETIQPEANENPDTAASLSGPEKRDVRPLRELLDSSQTETLNAPEVDTRPEPARAPESVPAPLKPDFSSLPIYVQLSHNPGQPINISKLPPEFYVVQLMSLTEKANLEAYFAKHKLIGLSAARVESNNQILYVLLLGIYESYDNARRASENMPLELSDINPWIRSLESLQKAMLRADELSGSSDY